MNFGSAPRPPASWASPGEYGRVMRAVFVAVIVLLAAVAPAAAEPLEFSHQGQKVFEGGTVEFRQLGVWTPAEVQPQTDTVAPGVTRVTITGPDSVDGVRIGFATAPGERFLGFGERSDEVVRAGGEVDNRVTEGPYQAFEGPFVRGFVPLPGQNERADATYFPIPWLLSTRGAGLLVLNDDHSVFRLGSPWTVEVDASEIVFEVFAGPRPVDTAAPLHRARRAPATGSGAFLLRSLVAAQG